MTAWSFSSQWVSPDHEGAVLLQHPLAFMPGPHCCGACCSWILAGAHHGHWCSRWILATLTKSHRCHSGGRAGLTQMLPCSDLAQMPEACDTCLEYFTGCSLCTWWEAHVRRCSGISSPFLFCTLKANLLHNKPAAWHDSSTGTCFSVPRDTGRLSRRPWSFSWGGLGFL